MSQSPATVDEVYAVFDREYAADLLGPASASSIARDVAIDRARATMTPEEYEKVLYANAFEGPDVAEALAQLVADGRLLTELGRAVRGTWPGVPRYKSDKPFNRDEAYYVRPEKAARWAECAKFEAELRAEAKAAVDRLNAVLRAAGVSAELSKRDRFGDITVRLRRPYAADRLAELLELAVEQERRQGGRR